MWAVSMQNKEIVQLLLQSAKIEINAGNMHGDTALHKAVVVDDVGKYEYVF